MKITFLVLIVAACITLFFVNALKPTSPGAFLFFAAWLVFPYVIMGGAQILAWRNKTVSIHWQVVAVAVSIGGILFLMDNIFWHPDAQGAIAVLMTPLLQGGAAAFLWLLVAWISRDAAPK